MKPGQPEPQNRLLGKRWCFIIAFMMFAVIAGLASVSWALPLTPAQKIQQSIDQVTGRVMKNFPHVSAIDPHLLQKKQTLKNLPPIIFDVRSKEEYDVSHLPAAMQLAPEISIEQFDRKYGGLLRLNPQRKIMFYCYIGYASFAMADKVTKAFPDFNGRVVALKGGVIQWHNQHYPLVDHLGPVARIHPHDFMWRGFLLEPETVSYEPRQNAGQ